MIATALTFVFGMLVTTLVTILITPLVWRKAQSLARRDYEATIPVSANEIRAEFDRVRAEASLSVRRQEILSAKANEKSARSQAELGRFTVENVELLKRVRGLDQTIDERDAELARLTAALAEKTADGERLETELAASRHETTLTAEELEALATRFQDLGEIAEERKIQLIAADAKLDRFADNARLTEREQREAQTTIDRLRDDLAAAARATAHEKTAATEIGAKHVALVATLADRDVEIEGLKERLAGSIPVVGAASGKRLVVPAPAAALLLTQAVPESAGQRLRAAIDRKNGTAEAPSPAALRDTISDLAARVIRMTALAEGPGSPLAGMLSPGEDGVSGTAPTLAERVRRLAEAERKAPAVADAQLVETRPE